MVYGIFNDKLNWLLSLMPKEKPQSNQILVRQAQPEDAPIASQCVHLTGPEIYTNMLGRNESLALKALERIFATPHALMSYDNCLIAELDGKIIGATIVYDKKTENEQGMRFFKEVYRSLPFGRFMLSFIYMVIMRFMVRRIGRNSLFGGSIAVSPDARSLGVGRALMDRIMEMVQKRGYDRFEADVETDNENALRIYRKYGFIIGPKRSTGIFRCLLGFEGFYRIYWIPTDTERE